MSDFLGADAPEAPGGMVRVDGFVARIPRDGEPISEATSVYLGYDEKSLHAVFVCRDSAPQRVRAHRNGRDRIPDADDSVALQLDTFRDRKHAYGFQVNPLGVQQDGIWTEGKGWDLSFDTTWDSQAQLTPHGYVVRVSVPFKSLRFDDAGAQSWGLLLFRGIARKNEEAFWPRYSSKVAGRMNQAGVLEGIGDVSPGRNMQLIPFARFRSSRVLDPADPRGPRFVSDAADAGFGVDGKVVLRDSVALDVTLKPDFSQVESDEPQVTVNKRFETFFPEKRPFFLENASAFDTPLPLLFTRRIVRPDLGVRVTGRIGPYALGGLLVSDRTDALFGVLRVNRDLGAESSLGVFFSSRTQGASFNRVGGLDSRVKIGAHWVGTVQAVASATRSLAGIQTSGPAYSASLARTGQKLIYTGEWKDVSDGFESASGFIQRRDVRELNQTLSYRLRPQGSRLLSWGPDVVLGNVWDHRNARLERTVTPKVSFEWPGQTTLVLSYQVSRARLRPAEVPALAEPMDFDDDRGGIELGTSFSRALTLAAKASSGTTVNLSPPPGLSPPTAGILDVSVTADIRPAAGLTVTAAYLLTRLTDNATGGRVFTDQIARLKTNYQFSRALSARAIVQYATLTAVPGRTRLQSRRNLNADVLLTYLRTPGTAVYVGYNNNFENIDPALVVTPEGLLRTPRRLMSDGWQLFLKASYLWRP